MMINGTMVELGEELNEHGYGGITAHGEHQSASEQINKETAIKIIQHLKRVYKIDESSIS